MIDETPYPKMYLYRRLVQAKQLIDTQYAENIDLEKMAGEAGLPWFDLVRLFESTYGKTPDQYLVDVRLAKAVTLLENGSSALSACEEVGFENATSFAGLFKTHYGLTVNQFVLKHEIRRQSQTQQALSYAR